MKKKLVTLSLFITLSIFAQGYKHFTIEQGLAGNRVYKILQDYDNFIWIATDKGISKFDGSTFKNFNISNGLPSNDIWQIVLTKDNKLWYLTRSNKIGYIKNDSIYNFSAQKDEFLYPTIFCSDSKQIFLKSYSNNYKLVDNKWEIIPSPSRLTTNDFLILSHPKNHVFFWIKRKNEKKRYFLADSLLQHKTEKILSYKDLITKGQINDSLLALSSQNGIHFINLNNSTVHNIIRPEIFKKNIFKRIIATDNSIQISTENFWARLDEQYNLTDIKEFPESFQLTTIIKDRQGNFWGTTYAKGIYFFPKNALSYKSYLTNEPVQFLKLYNNNLFAGIINKGIYRYNVNTDQFESFFEDTDYFFDLLYRDDDNFVILANKTSFIKKEGVLGKYYRIGKGILHLKDNLYAFRERDQITIFNSDNFKSIKSYPIEGVNDFIQYNDLLTCGTPVGLFQIQNDSIKQIEIDKKISPVPVLTLNKVADHLIIGTDGFGAFIWNGKDKAKLIKDTKGLIINNVFAKNDSIWLATQKGVFNYYFDNKKLHLNKILQKYDGIISNHVNNVVAFNNKVFTSNFSGVSSVNKNTIKELPIQKIYFKSVKYDRKDIHDYDKIKYKKNNNLLFNFGLINFAGQINNRYYYQLLPIHEKWLKVDSKNINFNNLKPDTYTFKVKTISPYGQKAEKSFHFTITPLWWQTGWAYFLIILLFTSIIFSLAYWTRRKALQKQKTRLLAQKQMAEFELHALRSQMNPHFVFNSLNAIQYYINDENYDQSEAYLVKFSRLIRMIFEFSRKKDITLRQEIDLLKSYLNLEKMRFVDHLNYCIEIDPKINIDKTTIPTLLLQPIVENAVNHGIFHKKGGGTICVKFNFIDDNTYEVLTQDDGVGVKRSTEINRKSLKKHQSRSTQILKDRIKLLNMSGKWEITYEMIDQTDNKQTLYNTIVKLKITKL